MKHFWLRYRQGWLFSVLVGRLGISIMRNAWRIEYGPDNAPYESGIRIFWTDKNPACVSRTLLEKISTKWMAA